SVALTVIQMVVAVMGAQGQVGLPKLVGNRDDMPVMQGFAGRAQRAHRNMLESLVLFAVLVLLAQVTGKANAMTALGAQLFFWGRMAYAVVYWMGIPGVRPAAWRVSIIGLLVIFAQLV